MMKNRVGADTSLHPALSNNKKTYPYLSEGVRIQYISREGATRSEIIARRDKTNILVVKDVLGRKKKIKIDWIIGYWPENVTPVSRNLRRIKDIKELIQQQLVVS